MYQIFRNKEKINMTHKVIIGEEVGYEQEGAELLEIILKEDCGIKDAVVEHTTDQNDLIERIKRGGYSVVLVGCCMGGVYGDQEGLNVVREMRKINSQLPIYLVNDGCGTYLKSQALEAGATGFFTRLMDLTDTIPETIKKHLE